MTAHYWRAIRLKFALAGINDPMRFSSMHVLLDVTESVILESMTSGDPKKDTNRRTQFLDKLYAPSKEEMKLNGDTYKPVPSGFEPEHVESSFDAFARAVGNG
jgi:hypothetical protein